MEYRYIKINKLNIIFICFVLVLLSGCNKIETNENNHSKNGSSNDFLCGDENQTYSDERFAFSADFPKKWDAEVTEILEPSTDFEGTPDSGIRIYITDDKDEYIYIFGQLGSIGVTANENSSEFETVEELITNTNLKGTYYLCKRDSYYELYYVLDDYNIGVTASLTQENYEAYKIEIICILKSIRIN